MLRENCRQAAALGAMHVRIEDADDDPDEDPAWGHEGADSYPGDDPYPVAVRPGGARTFGFLGTPALGGTSRPSHGALPPGVTVRHTRSLVLDAESRRGPPLA
ncbi:MAG: hypothetical protein JSR81_11490 [Proteobacteria bacterium]|nr:hypothetical protein [Pseudomonadota bacterium]